MRLIETGASLLCLVLIGLILYRKKVSFLVHCICASYDFHARKFQFRACKVGGLGYFVAYRLRANQTKPIENNETMKLYQIKYTECELPQVLVTRAYDREDAAWKFWGRIIDIHGSSHGIKIDSITRDSK